MRLAKTTRAKILEEIRDLEDEIGAEEDMRDKEGVDSLNLDKAYEQLDALYAKLDGKRIKES